MRRAEGWLVGVVVESCSRAAWVVGVSSPFNSNGSMKVFARKKMHTIERRKFYKLITCAVEPWMLMENAENENMCSKALKTQKKIYENQQNPTKTRKESHVPWNPTYQNWENDNPWIATENNKNNYMCKSICKFRHWLWLQSQISDKANLETGESRMHFIGFPCEGVCPHPSPALQRLHCPCCSSSSSGGSSRGGCGRGARHSCWK